MFFILLSTLTVMNMLVGVLVEVITVVSAAEKEFLTVSLVKSQLNSLMTTMDAADVDGNRKIDKGEFEALLTNPRAARILQDIGVDVVGLVDLSDHIFEDHAESGELAFADFMEVVLQLRGTNQATVRDMVDLRKHVSQQCHYIMGQMEVVVNAAKDSGGGAMAEDGPLAKAIKSLTEKMGAQSDSIARINTSVTSQMSVMQSLHDSGHASSLEGGRRGG